MLSGEEQENNFREFQIKYAAYRDALPEDFTLSADTLIEHAQFYYDIVIPFCKEIKSQLKKLMLAQYPAIANFTDDVALKHLDDVNSEWFTILYQLKKLFRNYSEKKNVKKEYPKLESWRDFYCNPKPNTVSEQLRNKKVYPTEEEWIKYIEHENREMLKFFNWEQRRYAAFYEIINATLQKFYPDIFNIEGDYWVIFAVIIRDEYENWKSLCEEFETTIEYEMPQESILWEYDKWQDEVNKRHDKYHEASYAKRCDSIDKG